MKIMYTAATVVANTKMKRMVKKRGMLTMKTREDVKLVRMPTTSTREGDRVIFPPCRIGEAFDLSECVKRDGLQGTR